MSSTSEEIDQEALPATMEGAPAWAKALILEAVRAATPPAYRRWISASVGAKVRILNVDEILFFRSDCKYTLVVMADTEVPIRRPISHLRCELDPDLWWTIHRSTIVNVRAIDEVHRNPNGRLSVSLKGRSEVLRVSDQHERQFRQM
jgi:DNA-binding LytR/AlgR family response regulator